MNTYGGYLEKFNSGFVIMSYYIYKVGVTLCGGAAATETHAAEPHLLHPVTHCSKVAHSVVRCPVG